LQGFEHTYQFYRRRTNFDADQDRSTSLVGKRNVTGDQGWPLYLQQYADRMAKER
jgi:hypothetical protein